MTFFRLTATDLKSVLNGVLDVSDGPFKWITRVFSPAKWRFAEEDNKVYLFALFMKKQREVASKIQLCFMKTSFTPILKPLPQGPYQLSPSQSDGNTSYSPSMSAWPTFHRPYTTLQTSPCRISTGPSRQTFPRATQLHRARISSRLGKQAQVRTT